MNKPFSSLYNKGSLKNRWAAVLKDPAYLFLVILLVCSYSYAEDGSVGTTSNGNSFISITIPPRVEIKGQEIITNLNTDKTESPDQVEIKVYKVDTEKKIKILMIQVKE